MQSLLSYVEHMKPNPVKSMVHFMHDLRRMDRPSFLDRRCLAGTTPGVAGQASFFHLLRVQRQSQGRDIKNCKKEMRKTWTV